MRLTAALLISLSLAASAQTIQVDGQTLPARAIQLSGRTLVPLRPIFQALGAKVTYAAGRIHGEKGDRTVDLTLGSASAQVNGAPVRLDVPARLIGTGTYVPLRFVAEALGAKITVQGSVIHVASVGGGPGPAPAPTPPPVIQAFQPGRDLKRIRVGNQAGILKVIGPNGGDMAFRGIDDRNIARYTPEGRAAVLAALGISSADGAARQIMDSYASLPKKEVLALLGALGAGPLDTATAQTVRRFLANKIALEKDVVLRRQAVLALAVQAATDRDATDDVLKLFERSDNLWETFTVQLFFEYQSPVLRRLGETARVRTRVAAVNSLYTPYILRYLDSDDTAVQVGF